MLIGYGDYTGSKLSFAINGSHSGAAFIAPSDASNLSNGRTGSVNSFSWIGGTQNTSSYVEITVTIDSDIDATANLGVIGICNCSLPVGTRITVQSIDQRLVADSRGERNAWFVPQTTGNTFTVRIWNDVNGVASIVALSEQAIGEIFVGRALSLNTLNSAPPSRQLALPDGPPQFERWNAVSRKLFSQVTAKLGLFTTEQAKGGSAASDIPDGAGSHIDIQTLQMFLSTCDYFAICDTSDAGRGAGTAHGTMRYDQTFMQTNWMIVRRLVNPSPLQMDQRPYWSWTQAFTESI